MDISIIIPTYNRLWCLPQAIASCRNNNCKVEIIVVDDGSTDGTLEWLYQHENIIVLQQDHIGKCWAVNKAFCIATGKYIRFLDSDDKLGELANDEQFALAESTAADVVVSGYQTFTNNNPSGERRFWTETDDFIAQQLGECDSSHYSAYLFKKSFIQDIPHRPDFALRDDRLFVLEVALKYPKVAIHKGFALLHRIGHNNRLQFTNGLTHCLQNNQHINIYKLILGKLQQQNQLTERRINASLNVLWPLAHWIAVQHPKEAKEVVDWIYQLNPNFIPPEKNLLGLLYRKAGFAATEKLLRLRRKLLFR